MIGVYFLSFSCTFFRSIVVYLKLGPRLTFLLTFLIDTSDDVCIDISIDILTDKEEEAERKEGRSGLLLKI